MLKQHVLHRHWYSQIMMEKQQSMPRRWIQKEYEKYKEQLDRSKAKYVILSEKEMKNIDKRRATNYKFYTDKQWGMAKNYSISLNSSELGYEMCEKIIEELIK